MGGLFYGPGLDPNTGLPNGIHKPEVPATAVPTGPPPSGLMSYMPKVESVLTSLAPFLPPILAYKLSKYAGPRFLEGISSGAERLGRLLDEPALRRLGQQGQQYAMSLGTPTGPPTLDLEEERAIEEAKQQQANAAAAMASQVAKIKTTPPPPPPPSSDTEKPNPVQVVMRDGKRVFITANQAGGSDKLGNTGQEAAKLRSMDIANAMYEGRNYTGTLGEMTPGNVPRVVPISSMRVGPGGAGPSSSMMQIAPGPQMDIGKEMAVRELESQQLAEAQAKSKVGIAEAAKSPAQQAGELAAAKEKGQAVGGIQGYLQGMQEVSKDPFVLAEVAKADATLKATLASIDPKLSPAERAKAEADAKAGHALRVQTIMDNAWNRSAAPQKVLGPGYELAGTPRS